TQHLDVGEPLLVVTVSEVTVLVVVDLVSEKDDALVVAKVRGLSCGDSLGPRSITVKLASPKLTRSPSRIGVVGNARALARPSPNIGRRIRSFSGSSRTIVSITPWGAMIGTSPPATSSVRPP